MCSSIASKLGRDCNDHVISFLTGVFCAALSAPWEVDYTAEMQSAALFGLSSSEFWIMGAFIFPQFYSPVSFILFLNKTVGAFRYVYLIL